MNKYIKKQDGSYVQLWEKEAILQKGKLIVLQGRSVIILGRYPNQATAADVLKKVEEWRFKGLVNIFVMPLVKKRRKRDE